MWMFVFAGQYIQIFALALLSCTKAGPISQINLTDWMHVEGRMKGEVGAETMTVKREDETDKENDRQLYGTGRYPRGREKQRKMTIKRVKTGRRQREIKK